MPLLTLIKKSINNKTLSKYKKSGSNRMELDYSKIIEFKNHLLTILIYLFIYRSYIMNKCIYISFLI